MCGRSGRWTSPRLDFGCCHINGPTVHDGPQAPLGGLKASGYGRFGGSPGINEFTEVQWVTIEDPSQPYNLTFHRIF